MPQATILTVLIGGSSAIGVIAVLAYLYFLLEFRRAETSVRGLIEGESLLSAKEIVQVLAQFKDDAQRLTALQTITSWGTTRNKDLLRSVREEGVNLKELNRIRAKGLEKRSLLIAVFFLALALVLGLSQYLTNEEAPPSSNLTSSTPTPSSAPPTRSTSAPPPSPTDEIKGPTIPPNAPTTEAPLPRSHQAAETRTSVASIGFIGGTVESVEKAFPGGTTQRSGDGFLHHSYVTYGRYPFTVLTYFSSENKATKVIAMHMTKQRSRSGDRGSFREGYDGDIFTYCKGAFADLKSEISNQLGAPVSPTLTAQKVTMNAEESAELVGGTGGRCHIPGHACSIQGWKANSRADFGAGSGPVSLSMNTRAAESSTFIENKSDNNTGGLCEIRIDGAF